MDSPPKGFRGKYWGKRVGEFRDRLYYLSRRRGILLEETHLAYLSSMPSEYWITEFPFRKPECRFFLELLLGYFAVMHSLEKCQSREEFLDKYGIPHDTTDLIPKNKEDFDKLRKLFGKETQQKHNHNHERIKIQRPNQN